MTSFRWLLLGNRKNLQLYDFSQMFAFREQKKPATLWLLLDVCFQGAEKPRSSMISFRCLLLGNRNTPQLYDFFRCLLLGNRKNLQLYDLSQMSALRKQKKPATLWLLLDVCFQGTGKPCSSMTSFRYLLLGNRKNLQLYDFSQISAFREQKQPAALWLFSDVCFLGTGKTFSSMTSLRCISLLARFPQTSYVNLHVL